MEEAAARIAQDNCELACCFIQKTAVEKAGPEMDKRLATVRPRGDEERTVYKCGRFSSASLDSVLLSLMLSFAFPFPAGV